MVYARIFWIDEKPIRQYLTKNERDDRFLHEIGHKVLLISLRDSFQNTTLNLPAAQPFLDKGLSFFPYRSFHASDFCVLLWTGQRMEILPDLDGKRFDFLYQLQQQVGHKHMITAISRNERDLAVSASRGWEIHYKKRANLAFIGFMKTSPVITLKGQKMNGLVRM